MQSKNRKRYIKYIVYRAVMRRYDILIIVYYISIIGMYINGVSSYFLITLILYY